MMLKLTAADGLSSHEQVLIRLDRVEAVEYRDETGGRNDRVIVWMSSGSQLSVSGANHANTLKIYQKIEGVL